MFYFLTLGLIMIVMGVSDALRGVFIPVFAQRYALTNSAQSAIVGVSYLGSLVFLLIGGRLTDRFSKKKVAVCVVLVWMAALAGYLVTDSYAGIVCGMFFTMGTSMLLCTIVNLMTPEALKDAPGMMINLLFFVQGIGTTFSQKVIGSLANSISVWKIVNGLLFVCGIAILVLFHFFRVPEQKAPKGEKISLAKIVCRKEFYLLVLITGMYMVAEHGLMNWLVTYCMEVLGFSRSQGATCLALFFGTITVGRLVFSPVIRRFGLVNGLVIFGAGAVLFYVLSFSGGASTIWLLAGAGIFVSVLYPTMAMAVQNYYAPSVRATASGWVIGAATVFDILFNFGFGGMIDRLGFHRAVWTIPAAMALCYAAVIALKVTGKETNKIA